jgi:hypothetical protein
LVEQLLSITLTGMAGHRFMTSSWRQSTRRSRGIVWLGAMVKRCRNSGSMSRKQLIHFHFVVHISQFVICFFNLYRSGEYFDCVKTCIAPIKYVLHTPGLHEQFLFLFPLAHTSPPLQMLLNASQQNIGPWRQSHETLIFI